jgi:hypothetical protein
MRAPGLLCALLCSLLSGLAVFGETGAGTISGSVCDLSGVAIAGAAIEAQNSHTKVVYSAASSSTGSFTIAHLPAGQYAITVRMQGMKPYAHSYVEIDGPAVIREDVTLETDNAPAYVFPYNPPPAKPVTRPAFRDFYAEDAEFVLTSPVLSLNGSGFELPKRLNVVKGKFLWVYLPGHGRYFLSLSPDAEQGLSLAGQVGGSTLQFQSQNDEIQIDAADRILMGSATYNLYVGHQSDWLPANESDRSAALMGSTDRLR